MKSFQWQILYFLFISFLGTHSHALWAKSNPVISSWNTYVGTALGFSSMDVRNDHYQYVPGDADEARYYGNAKGMIEHLFVGAQKKLSNFSFGGEVYGFLSQQRSKVYVDIAPGENRREMVQRNYGFGIKAIGGYYLNSYTHFYLHGGIENAEFEYKGRIILSPEEKDFRKRKMLQGFPFGAGIETKMISRWKTRLEYTYSQYKSWKTGNLLNNNKIVASKLLPNAHNIVLGITYQI